MSEELKKLAIEAIKIKKRIQADTEKLQELIGFNNIIASNR